LTDDNIDIPGMAIPVQLFLERNGSWEIEK
jgi:hypothetical protein